MAKKGFISRGPTKIWEFEPNYEYQHISRELGSIIPELKASNSFTGILDLEQFQGYHPSYFSGILGARYLDMKGRKEDKLYILSFSKKIFGTHSVLYDLMRINSLGVEEEDADNDLIVVRAE